MADEQRRRRGRPRESARNLRPIRVELVGVRAERQRRRRVAARFQIGRHGQDTSHAETTAGRLQPPPHVGVGQRVFIPGAKRAQLLGQQRRRRGGRGRPQPPPELVLEGPARDLVREEPEQRERRHRRHNSPRQQPAQKPP